MMFCTNCGTKRSVASAFCAQCGNKFQLQSNENVLSQPNDSSQIRAVQLQEKTNTTEEYQSVKSKMTGRLHLKYEVCKVLAERQELEIKGSARADSTVSSTTGTNGIINSIHGRSHFSLEIGSTTTYSHWVKWENGIEELVQLPMECRPGQSLICILARREYPGEGEEIPAIGTKRNGVPVKVPFFRISNIGQVQDPYSPFFHIGTANLETRAQHSRARDFVFLNVTEGAKEWIEMEPIVLFGIKLRKSDNKRLSFVSVFETAVADTEQHIKTISDAAIISMSKARS